MSVPNSQTRVRFCLYRYVADGLCHFGPNRRSSPGAARRPGNPIGSEPAPGYTRGVMGLFDETGLQRLVDAGCPKCGSIKLVFRTYLDGLVPLMGGEPIGRVKWVYDGEKFVDGVYRIVCAGC